MVSKECLNLDNTDCMEVSLVYPHQLYSKPTHLTKDRTVVLIEEPLFFFDIRYKIQFHQQKLVLHRASMKAYEHELQAQGYKTKYISYVDATTTKAVFEILNTWKVKTVHVADPTDDVLHKRIRRYTKNHDIECAWYESSLFICTSEDLQAYRETHKGYFQTDFYVWQRKRLGIMLEYNGKPQGGKWTYDSDNRKKLPKNIELPPIKRFGKNAYVTEAIQYIDTHFNKHPGIASDFAYATTRAESLSSLQDFLKYRFEQFGPYQDAIEKGQSWNFHSVLSSSLNIGLLDPLEAVQQAITFADKHDTPLSSLEGFVRQIIGWREFMRFVYKDKHVALRTTNFFDHHRHIPRSFWDGSTGIEPIDSTIQKVLETAYGHHIERLMVLGNFMLLCQFDPDEIYDWFMTFFIDAYDWVMVPNVYAMSLFADGGSVTTKPYISSSNYIKKMSNYPKGEWCDVWDALYWYFIDRQKEKLYKNPRMLMMYKLWEKKTEEQRQMLIARAEAYLQELD